MSSSVSASVEVDDTKSGVPALAERVGARVAAIDLVRGAVMLLMAIDHVRVYAGVPPGGASPEVFLTRWITHFCAPAFVFLAGTSAFFRGRKHAGLPRYLLVRGAWLVLLELTVVRLAWTFNLDFARQMAGVIWVIGWCMILLAGVVKLPIRVVAILGLGVIGAHNLTDAYRAELFPALAGSAFAGLWKILYLAFFEGPIELGAGATLIVLYTIVPWVGVMAAGYAFGRVLALAPARRDRICLWIGLGAVTLFLLLRGFDLYGDPRPWNTPDGHGMPAWLAFLNTTKYPASLAFLLMTLGPTIALMPALERARGALWQPLRLFGRVPFFYYVLHIPLIHALALFVSLVRTGDVNPWLFTNHPMGNPPPPDGYTWSLPLLYGVWGVAVLLLYPACRWIDRVKTGRRSWWSGYV